MNTRTRTRQLPPSRRLYIKVCELGERIDRLVECDRSPEVIEKLSRVERRYWQLEQELLRRLDERDAQAAEMPRLLVQRDAALRELAEARAREDRANERRASGEAAK